MQILGSVFCFVSAAMFLGAREGHSDLTVAKPDQLRTISGNEEGLCCVPESGAVCETNPTIANCVPNQVGGCECADEETICYRVHVPPMKHDTCVLPINEPATPIQCSYSSQTTWCYKIEVGGCDHDAGPWQWDGLCWTCGCDYNNSRIEEVGTRIRCSASSSACP